MLQTYQVVIQGSQLRWLQTPPIRNGESKVNAVIVLDSLDVSKTTALNPAIGSKGLTARRCLGALTKHTSSATLLADMALLRQEWDV